MTSSIETLIGRPLMGVFRRAEIKRRQSSDGKFEPSWYDITELVKGWGSFESAVDDIRLNRFTHSGLTLVTRNDGGDFNPETNGNSLWNGYMTRYRTLVRIQAGYHDEAQDELPTDTTQGIYVMSDEILVSPETLEATIQCRSLVSIFDEVRAVDIPGIGTAQSASDIIAKVRDHSDGSGNNIFREFITSTAWTIQTTTAQYNFATSGSLGEMTAWDLMSNLAEAEGYVVLVNRTGGLEFRDRNARDSVSTFSLYGQGYPEMNVIGIQEVKEPWNRVYNFFRLKHLQEDTSTSYVTAGTQTTVDPSSTAWKYGSRVYSFDGDYFPNTAAAQATVDNLLSVHAYDQANEDATIKCKFLPSVEVLDKVDVSYQSFSINGTTLWDFFDWNDANWDSEFGENINWSSKAFKIIGKTTDLDQMTTVLRLQEI